MKHIIYIMLALFAVSSCAVIVKSVRLNISEETAGKVIYENPPVIVVDAGHGGFDGGAEANGILEKDITLLIAQKMELIGKILGFNIVMTRPDDNAINDSGLTTIREKKKSDMYKRLKIMTAYKGAPVISVHLNKYSEEYVRGGEVYYSPKTEDAKLLAEIIQNNYKMIQPYNKRKTKKAEKNLFLLYNNSVAPAVIAECGFISNKGEAQNLKDNDYQTKMAIILIKSAMDYYCEKGN